MDDYMSKPVQKAVLIETINKWVKPGETGHATAPSALDDLPRGTVGRTVEVTSSPPPLQQPSVLLVDESIDRLLYVKWVLENEGLVVDTAENGIHAVQLLGGGSSKYQAVMVALGLQLMTTTSVRDELSKPNLQAGDRKLRVILLRDASHENVQVPNLNTVHGILDLPIQTEQLRSVLEGICPGAAAHRQSPPSTSSMPSRSISTDLLWRRSLIGRHVLLIEDNHSMQGAIMQMLQLEGLVVDAISEEARCSQGIPSAGQYDMALLNNLTTATVAAIKAIKTSQPHLPVICICRVTTMTGGRKFSPDWVLSSRNLHRAAIMEAIYKLTVDRPRSSPAIEPHAKMPKAPLDVKVALDLYDGDWDFVQDLLDCFLEGEREHVAELMEAELRCDLGRIKFLAHALRGSTGSCCMAAATEMFAQLEEICNRTLSGGPNAPTEYPQHIVSVCCGVSQQLYLNAAAFKVWLGGLKALEIAPGLACAGGDFDKLMDAMLVMMQSATSAICGESNEAIDDADLVACITSTPFAEQAAPRLHAAALAHQLSCTGRDESMSKIKAELRKLEADLCGLQTFRGLG